MRLRLDGGAEAHTPERAAEAGAAEVEGAGDDASAETTRDSATLTHAECTQPMCMAGTEAQCSTVCGTEGVGLCSPSCQPAASNDCKPPAETCNARDDDCDGATDENVISRLEDGALVWTGVPDPRLGTKIHFLASDFGTWLTYQPANPGPLVAHRLQRNGAPWGPGMPLEQTARFNFYEAHSNGQFVVVAGIRREFETDRREHLDLQLYDAATLQLLDELPDALNLHCQVTYHFEVVVAQDSSGSLQVAVAALHRNHNLPGDEICGDGAGEFWTELHFWRRTQVAGWSARRDQRLADTTTGAKLVRVPCADEWLVPYAGLGATGSITRGMMRLTLSGMPLSVHHPELDAIDVWDAVFDSTAVGCDDTRIYMLAPTLSDEEKPSLLLRIQSLTLERKTGKVKSDDPIPLDLKDVREGRLVFADGRLFAVVTDEHSDLHVLEVSLAGETKGSVREIALDAIDSVDPQYDAADKIGAFARATAAAWIGQVLVVGTSKTNKRIGAERFREPGDELPPAVVTYRIGCPE